MDYTNIPTTVFTVVEYGACGLSEEAAIEKYPLLIELKYKILLKDMGNKLLTFIIVILNL